MAQIPFYQRQVAPQVQSMPRGSTAAAAAPWEALAGVGQAVQGLGEKGMQLASQIQSNKIDLGKRLQAAEDSNTLDVHSRTRTIYERTRAEKIKDLVNNGYTQQQISNDADLKTLDSQHQSFLQSSIAKVVDPTKRGSIQVDYDFNTGDHLSQKTGVLYTEYKAQHLTHQKETSIYKFAALGNWAEAEASIQSGLTDGILTGPQATAHLESVRKLKLGAEKDAVRANLVDLDSINSLKKAELIAKDDAYRALYPEISETEWRTMTRANNQRQVFLKSQQKEKQFEEYHQYQAQVEAGTLDAAQLEILKIQNEEYDKDGDPVGLAPHLVRILNGRLKAMTAESLPEDVADSIRTLPETLGKTHWFYHYGTERQLSDALVDLDKTKGLTANQKYYAANAMTRIYNESKKNPDRGTAVTDAVSRAYNVAVRINQRFPEEDPFYEIDKMVRSWGKTTDAASVNIAVDSWIAGKKPKLQQAVEEEVAKARGLSGAPSIAFESRVYDQSNRLVGFKFKDGEIVRID